VLDEPTVTMGGLNGSIDLPPRTKIRQKPDLYAVDWWRRGAIFATVLWVLLIAMLAALYFGGKP
jgi:hypothetical protein